MEHAGIYEPVSQAKAGATSRSLQPRTEPTERRRKAGGKTVTQQQVHAGRDAYVAGQNQTNINYPHPES